MKILKTLIDQNDAKGLFEYDFEITPFYCPECDMKYSKSEWLYWDAFDEDGWHDSIRGSCPADHQRMLED